MASASGVLRVLGVVVVWGMLWGSEAAVVTRGAPPRPSPSGEVVEDVSPAHRTLKKILTSEQNFTWGTHPSTTGSSGPGTRAMGAVPFLGEPTDALPVNVGSVLVGTPLQWKGSCFTRNTAVLRLLPDGGGELNINTQDAKELLCNDMYLIVTAHSWSFETCFARGDHVVRWTKFSEQEREDVQRNGMRLLMFGKSMLTTMLSLYEIYKVTMSDSHPADVREFYKKHAGLTFVDRKDEVLPVQPKDIRSGDVLFLFTVAGFEVPTVWVTGMPTGHVAMALWDGPELYVVETTRADDSGMLEGVQRTPWGTWVARRHALGYAVMWARPKAQSFDSSAAWEFFREYDGMPFGYQTLVPAAVDTMRGNLPPPLTPEVVPVVVDMLSMVMPKQAQSMVYDPLNIRFLRVYGARMLPRNWTNCTTLSCVQATAAHLGTDLLSVLAIPEQDDWRYDLGVPRWSSAPSLICDVFVMHLLRVGGALPGFPKDISLSEFTPKDVAQVQIYDEEWAQPSYCRTSGGKRGWCQIMGPVEVELSGFNSIPAYAHMNERCAALPPSYTRTPEKC
eukprot:RCo046749